jgi:photosystem II stability/assembly factor-like uncharacterized protein
MWHVDARMRRHDTIGRPARAHARWLRSIARFATTCCAIAALLSSRSARANGRYPKADQLVIANDDPAFLAVRTTFGFLVSHDSGQNWDWICEHAIGYSGVQDPTLGLMESGTIIASLSEGIAHSTDQGCNWDFAEADLSGSPVIDLTVRKDAPSHALALVWDAQMIGYSSRIVASDDNGRSFLPFGNPIDPTVLVTTLDVAPSSAQRVYASGTRSVDGVRSGLLFRSDDQGEHWTEYPVPFDPKLEQGVYIAAVDPEDADTVYLRTNSATVSRLLISHDGGQQFTVGYSGSLLSFALSPDGKQLYFGGEDGLYAGAASDSQFEKRASVRVLCLAATEDTVYACSDEHSGFTVGASHDGGATFEPLLHLDTVRGPLSCSAAECEDDWPLVRAQLGIPLPSETDAGVDASAGSAGDAGNTSAPLSRASARSSCAVGVSTASSSSVFGSLLALALAGLSRRRRSPARSRLPAK